MVCVCVCVLFAGRTLKTDEENVETGADMSNRDLFFCMVSIERKRERNDRTMTMMTMPMTMTKSTAADSITTEY